MSKKRAAPLPESGELLNLPLDGTTQARLEPQDLLPFESDDETEPPSSGEGPAPRPSSEASFGDRLVAGVLDLVAVVAAAGSAGIGAWALGAPPGLPDVPAFGLFVASFSFLYIVIPLTFWARTPGMSFAALIARGHDAVPLTIKQSFRRWLGAVLTVALLGLPTLLALRGLSLADRLSGTRLRRRD